MIEELKKHATVARRWAMRNRDKYYSYDNLMGMCAIASGYLHKRLQAKGIESVLCYNDGHCFVRVDDYIVDVTATQFGDYKPVEIFPVHEATERNKYCWKIEKEFETTLDLYTHQKKERWPSTQLVVI